MINLTVSFVPEHGRRRTTDDLTTNWNLSPDAYDLVTGRNKESGAS